MFTKECTFVDVLCKIIISLSECYRQFTIDLHEMFILNLIKQ